ncbi:MAG: Ig-like domain-containing protein, partial [Pseudomonadota bacterium]
MAVGKMSTWYKIEFETSNATFDSLNDASLPYDDPPLLIEGQELLSPFWPIRPSYGLSRDIDVGVVASKYFDTVRTNIDPDTGDRSYTVRIIQAKIAEQKDASTFAPDLEQRFVPTANGATIIDGLSYTDLGLQESPSLGQRGVFREGQLILMGPDTNIGKETSFNVPLPEYIWVLQDNDFVAGEPYLGFPELISFTSLDDVIDFGEISRATGTVLWDADSRGFASFWRSSGSGNDTVILPTEAEANAIRNQFYARETIVFLRYEILGHEAFFAGSGNDTIDASKAEPIPWYLYGERGNDILIGSSADDALFFGSGENTLTGGPGADLFKGVPRDFDSNETLFVNSFSSRGDYLGTDTITDFERFEDKIDLSEWDDAFGDVNWILRGPTNFPRKGDIVMSASEEKPNGRYDIELEVYVGFRELGHRIIVENQIFSFLTADDFIGVSEPDEIKLLDGFTSDEGDDDQTAGTAVAPVSLSREFDEDVIVEFETFDNTATLEDGDYEPLKGNLTIPSGQTLADIEVVFLGDTKLEDDEQVGVRLLSAKTVSGEDIDIGKAETFVRIRNDDLAIKIVSLDQLAGSSFIDFLEGGPAKSVRISIDEPVDFDITVDYRINNPDLVEDVRFQQLVLPANKTTVDIPLGFALQDNYRSGNTLISDIEEWIEQGTVTFTARGGGKTVEITEGETLTFRIEDELHYARNAEMLKSESAWSDFVGELNFARKVVDGFFRILNDFKSLPIFEGVGSFFRRLSIGVDAAEAVGRFGEKSSQALAKYLATDISDPDAKRGAQKVLAAELYNAYEDYTVEVTDIAVGWLFSAGKAVAAAGILTALAGSSLAAIPALAIGTVVVGASIYLGYDNTIKNFVESATRAVYRSNNPYSEFEKDFVDQVEPVPTNVQRGELDGAMVFVDTDGDLELDATEIPVTTDENGNADVPDIVGTLVAVDGIDTATGLPFNGTLLAPSGSSVVTPLTTLFYFLGGTEDAKRKLFDALGLDASKDLTQYNPMEAARAGANDAVSYLVATAKTFIFVSFLAGVIEQKTGKSPQEAFLGVMKELAGIIDREEWDTGTKNDLVFAISSILDASVVELPEADRESLAEISATIFEALDGIPATIPQKAMIDVEALQYVALAELNQEIKVALENASPLALLKQSYSGQNLADAVADAKKIIPIATQTSGAPIATDDTAETDEDNSVTFNILDNDSDPDGDPILLNQVFDTDGALIPFDVETALVGGGTITISQDGTTVFDPAGDFEALGFNPQPEPPAATFDLVYNVVESTDEGLVSDNATVTIDVRGLNDAPVADDFDAETTEDVSVILPVLDMVSDVDGDDLELVFEIDPAIGEITFDGEDYRFTPAPDVNGDFDIQYIVTDENDSSTTGTLSLTVEPVNDDPVAVDDDATTDQDTFVAIDFLANDSDPDGDGLTVTSVGPASNGVASLTGYTPDPGFFGTDSFTYTISDGNGGTATATAKVTVNQTVFPNRDPVAVDDDVTTDQDTFVAIDFLANDSDPDGDGLTVTSVGPAS